MPFFLEVVDKLVATQSLFRGREGQFGIIGLSGLDVMSTRVSVTLNHRELPSKSERLRFLITSTGILVNLNKRIYPSYAESADNGDHFRGIGSELYQPRERRMSHTSLQNRWIHGNQSDAPDSSPRRNGGMFGKDKLNEMAKEIAAKTRLICENANRCLKIANKTHRKQNGMIENDNRNEMDKELRTETYSIWAERKRWRGHHEGAGSQAQNSILWPMESATCTKSLTKIVGKRICSG